jgi:hypothetical protein
MAIVAAREGKEKTEVAVSGTVLPEIYGHRAPMRSYRAAVGRWAIAACREEEETMKKIRCWESPKR